MNITIGTDAAVTSAPIIPVIAATAGIAAAIAALFIAKKRKEK